MRYTSSPAPLACNSCVVAMSSGTSLAWGPHSEITSAALAASLAILAICAIVFVYGLDWGIRGSAWGTVIAQMEMSRTRRWLAWPVCSIVALSAVATSCTKSS